MSHDVVIRAATPEDAPVCGDICYRAFSSISAAHGFPCDFPAPEVAVGAISMLFDSPGFYCVVAEEEDTRRVLGSNCLDERSPLIYGVGPITVDPNAQNARVGRKLMQAVLDRASTNHAAGVRLVQSAFHSRSLSLYSGLGFDIREPLSCMQGRTLERELPGCAVRTAVPSDIAPCNALSIQVHGFDRNVEVSHAIEEKIATVVERGGRIRGYATSLGFFGHATAETNLDMQALIAHAESFGGPGILVPSRNNALFRWCLANGLRVLQPMTYMTTGLYNEPAGAWLPSISF
ncbi:MAG TPA: GNAT family N-acetyltransferase [Bryobacteraceae bacterium]|jgi:predicted N-acetyltransferase YhbS